MTRLADLSRRMLLSAAALLSLASAAHAQSYPSRDITLVIPFGIGGSTDIIGRQFAGDLAKVLGAKINVENKPGGTGTIGSTQVIQSRPDGYTIGFVANDALVLQPLLNPALVFKTSDDYQPIVKLGYRSDVLYVRADAPWKTYADFVADAKQNPGKMRVAIPGVGTLGELTIQKLNKVAGVRIVTVPFSGGGAEATLAVLGGRVEASAGSVSVGAGHVAAGRLRALAVFQRGKHAVYPEAASIDDTHGDVSILAEFYVFAPKGLPKDVLDKLVAASTQVGRSDDWAAFAKKQDFVPDVKGPDATREDLLKQGKDFAERLADK
ncbi:MAG: Bug family tripartite tricarboxylate transporter substrate binding protein [Rhodospirillales bacterium]|jgi:tripartite-type tricarboxylate transporter receptor subunit TctC|nr:tripartite tricarboxylate transporter substrate binding protein [Magnetospirillum sp.]